MAEGAGSGSGGGGEGPVYLIHTKRDIPASEIIDKAERETAALSQDYTDQGLKDLEEHANNGGGGETAPHHNKGPINKKFWFIGGGVLGGVVMFFLVAALLFSLLGNLKDIHFATLLRRQK